MRKSDFTNRPDIFGRSNYLVREMLALVEQAGKASESGLADLGAYWQDNASVVGEFLGLPEGEPEPLPGNQALVTNNDTFSLLGGTFTASVEDNAIAWSLQATRGIVQDGQTFAVDGGEVAVSVSGNSVSLSFTPDDGGGDGGDGGA